MSDDTASPRRRRSGGRQARTAARLHAVAEKVPFITRTLAPFEVLSEEGLSTIEHIGVGAYEQDASERADLAAMRRIRDLTEVGGLLLLTTSYGPAAVDDFSRTYDRAGLDELLDGWEVEELVLLTRRDKTTWVPLDPGKDTTELNGRETVVMVAATRTG